MLARVCQVAPLVKRITSTSSVNKVPINGSVSNIAIKSTQK